MLKCLSPVELNIYVVAEYSVNTPIIDTVTKLPPFIVQCGKNPL